MPISIRRAIEVDRSYYDQAACRTSTGHPKIAWTAEPGVMYEYGGHRYRGERLIELARQTCAICPVQWECASTAIKAYESAGTWGDTIDNIRWLARNHPTTAIVKLEMAKSTGVTVQRTIQLLRTRLT